MHRTDPDKENTSKDPVAQSDTASPAGGKPAAPQAADGAPGAEDACGAKAKKRFRFVRPIEELYDEAAKTEAQGQPETGASDEKSAGGSAETPEDDAGASKGEDDDAEPSAGEEADAQAAAAGQNGTEPEDRRGSAVRRLLYAGSVIAVSVVLALAILSVFADRYGIAKSDEKVDVTIPHGANVKEVADVLKKDGVINNALSFRLFVKQNHYSDFQEGTYTLNPTQGYEEIVAVLRNPNNNKNNVRVQITEGQTVAQVAATLEKAGVCTQQDFLNTLEAGGFVFPLGAKIPNDKNRYYKYEGYLFPDTYTLLKNSSGKAAIQKMLSNFTSKFTSAMQQQAAKRGMTVDQAVTLASIVQKEGDTSIDRQNVMKHVASVFYNRLQVGVNGKKLLQSDATILYAKRDLSDKLQSADAALASNYNTYRFEGLPPGPICSPGMDAFNAVLNPAQTNDLYFVSDANGNYYFAQDYTQHLKNVKTAAKKGTIKAAGDLGGTSSTSK